MKRHISRLNPYGNLVT